MAMGHWEESQTQKEMGKHKANEKPIQGRKEH